MEGDKIRNGDSATMQAWNERKRGRYKWDGEGLERERR
jgi:hypothetical protein